MEDSSFRNIIFGNDTETYMQNRKLLLQKLTKYSQQREVMKLLYSKRKASRVLIIFIEQF